MPQSTETVNKEVADANSNNHAAKETVNGYHVPVELDDFGLPAKKNKDPVPVESDFASRDSSEEESQRGGSRDGRKIGEDSLSKKLTSKLHLKTEGQYTESESEDEFKDAPSTPNPEPSQPQTAVGENKTQNQQSAVQWHENLRHRDVHQIVQRFETHHRITSQEFKKPPTPSPERNLRTGENEDIVEGAEGGAKESATPEPEAEEKDVKIDEAPDAPKHEQEGTTSPSPIDVDSKDPPIDTGNVPVSNGQRRGQAFGGGVSEWSHQQLAPHEAEVMATEEDEWQTMPAFAPYDIYDDNNRIIAREAAESDDGADAYAGLGGAGKGYTRVQLDEDAQSATSMDENTQYLFKDVNAGTGAGEEEDEEQRDAVSQMQATKDLLTEGQRIAYVGMTRLMLSVMLREAESIPMTKGSKKDVLTAAEAMQMWSQKMMVRLYAHMEISTAEQIMIEQLSEHGVVPSDLTPTLMQNARVKNPMAEKVRSSTNLSSPKAESIASLEGSARPSISPVQSPSTDEPVAGAPPPYEEHEGEDLPEVRTPSQLPITKNIDIDLRWTVLCDLFLTLIADSVYDARSRVLLEKIGENMDVSWLEICRFEKRVTDALEMQQAAEKENWNEDEHKETRRKAALKKRYVMMGLATVGGGLVIGLSAGLLAPVIGAGLAAGFTTIGVAGTSGFLAGASGAAIITSAAATSGGIIAVRAADRRTGAVKTFEYRPLHNNKRVNLIVTVSGWMTGKVDDVRLPYSTVDPIMGDIYSVLWEPEMLTSMGDTINILATEALTQGLQQVLGSTILIGLMAALQLPVVLTKLAYLIDNPWTVSLDRANAAGLILADSLIDRNLGTRPITFVGYSLGSRVIFSCLRELARKGAHGIVQNVYLFGSPIVAKKDEYLKARAVVAGRFVNGYAKNDWILGYLFRLTSGGISRVAGLAPVDGIPGLENVDVTEFVPGHMAYRTAMPRLLREVGWAVESDEFTEIEDPDPDNHQQRQRELINEIEEARKNFEKEEPKSKGKFSLFGRKKKIVLEKKEWETYEESHREPNAGKPHGSNDGVLFDIEAIRAELASEHMEVRELQSTLPPMRLNLGSPSLLNPRDALRETKSFDAGAMLQPTQPKTSPSPSPSPSSRQSFSNTPIDTHEERWPDEEEEVQMTFDTSYHSPSRSARTSTDGFTLHHSPYEPPPADPVERAVALQRPELKSSNTLPAATSLPTVSLDHNAWADDDEDFGHERGIEMTFA